MVLGSNASSGGFLFFLDMFTEKLYLYAGLYQVSVRSLLVAKDEYFSNVTIMFRRQQLHTCIVKCWECHIKRQAKIIPGEKCTATQETISRNH